MPNDTHPPPVPPENLVYDPLTGIVTFLGERECDPTDPDVFIVAGPSAALWGAGPA